MSRERCSNRPPGWSNHSPPWRRPVGGGYCPPVIAAARERTAAPFAGGQALQAIGGFDGFCSAVRQAWLVGGLGVRTGTRMSWRSRTALEAQGGHVLACVPPRPMGSLRLWRRGTNPPRRRHLRGRFQAHGVTVARSSRRSAQARARRARLAWMRGGCLSRRLGAAGAAGASVGQWRMVAMGSTMPCPCAAICRIAGGDGDGHQIAQDTADLLIPGDVLEAVVEALALARDTIGPRCARTGLGVSVTTW